MIAIFGAALFALASAGILWLSWRSLRSSKVHGFYRFFAFEILALLISVNLPIWFRDPWCARQLCSYAFGALSIALAVEGFRLLRLIGRPSASVSQGTNLAFENTSRLVICGAYRYIRHPLYASLLALASCAWLKAPLSLANSGMFAAVAGFLVATALAEEKENVARFGSGYVEYMGRTRRFIPFIF